MLSPRAHFSRVFSRYFLRVLNRQIFPNHFCGSELFINEQVSPNLLSFQRREKCNRITSTDSQTKNNIAHLYQADNNIPLIDKTVGQLLSEIAAEKPNHEYIISIHQNLRLTYANILQRVDKLAAGLRKLDLKKGDNLAMWGPNDVEWILTMFAAARLGLILVAINPSYKSSELTYCLQKVDVKAIIVADNYKTQNYANIALHVKPQCPALEHIIVCSNHHVTGTRRFEDVESMANRIEIERVAAEQSDISCYKGCNLQFTSGTTGNPKAVLISHRSLVNNSLQAMRRAYFDHDSKVCLHIPFFHAFGVAMGIVGALYSGHTLVIPARSFNPVKSLEISVAEKCNTCYGTPTMWVNMVDVQQRLNLPLELRKGLIGGAFGPPELFKRIRKILGIKDIKSIYGLTETTAVVFESCQNDEDTLIDTTVGHLSNHAEAMIVDEEDKPVPFGTPGELWIRCYSNMLKYVNDEESTRKTITKDGWLKTGDLFILRSNGYGEIIGRKKDIIIRGGENIYPKEIEKLLLTYPNVLEAQVIGVYDEVYGEEVCACVRLREGTEMTKAELQDYCRQNIADYKTPKYIEFVTSYPKTASGKIQNYLLKKDLERRGIILNKSK